MRRYFKVLLFVAGFAIICVIIHGSTITNKEIKTVTGEITKYTESHEAYRRWHYKRVQYTIESSCVVSLEDGSSATVIGAGADNINDGYNKSFTCEYTYFKFGEPSVKILQATNSDGESIDINQ